MKPLGQNREFPGFRGSMPLFCRFLAPLILAAMTAVDSKEPGSSRSTKVSLTKYDGSSIRIEWQVGARLKGSWPEISTSRYPNAAAILSHLAEPSTAPSLLEGARKGQPEAWQRFVHLYGPLIYRWVRRSGMQSNDAADVTQDVLVSVSKDLANFDPSRSDAKFRGWLWTITRRRIADAVRACPAEQLAGSAINEVVSADSLTTGRLSNGPLSNDPLSNGPPTDAAIDRQTLLIQAVAIYRDRFDPKTWKAFWATVVEGRRPDEVAETLGMNRWGVYKARARILQRLRTELAGILDEDS